MPRNQIIYARKPCNHTFHIVMTIITLGAWLPIYGLMFLVSLDNKVPVGVVPVPELRPPPPPANDNISDERWTR